MSASKAFIVAVFCIAATMAACPAPKRLAIKGCPSEPCAFYYYEEIEAQVDFSVVNNTEKLWIRLSVIAVEDNILLPYDLAEENPCLSLTNGKCPLTIGEEVTYQLKMSILNKGWTDNESIKLDFDLIDDNGKIHVCFFLDATITEKSLNATQSTI